MTETAAYTQGARDIIQHLRDQGIEITYHQQKAIDEFLDYAQDQNTLDDAQVQKSEVANDQTE